MYQTILVPLDGSPFGERALPYAAGVAERVGAAVELVHVHHLPDVGGVVLDPTLDERLRESESSYLAAWAARFGEISGQEATPRLLAGEPVHAIADHVDKAGIDLIVMTTHGRGGFQRAWLGSVADGLVRRAGCPILLIRPDGAGGEAPVEYRHVLVPLDGTAVSEQILPHATALATPGTTNFTLLRVVPPSLALGGHVIRLDEERLAEVAATARRGLERVAAGLRDRGFETGIRVISHQTPAQAILDWAAEKEADLIAMTTRSEGGLARLMLGSTADKVLRATRTPLLLFHPTL